MDTKQVQYIEEDEIDLRELFKTIIKNKILIAVITSIITLTAIGYAYMAPKIYEAKAVVEIGSVKYNNNSNNSNNSALENSNNIVKRLQIEYMENTAKNQDSVVTSVSLIKGTEGLIEIVVHSILNEKAKKYIHEIIFKIQKEHQEIINNYKTLIVQNIENLKQQKKELENDKVGFDESKKIQYELSSQINDLNLVISPLNIKETKLLGKVILNDFAIKPKKKLIVAVAFITGLILSIFLVFFMEFISKNKEDA